ncbi:MAG TPA: hypothetical protein PK611_09075 [Saprospiraceae bacterium]|nr:hypothetical protein [Saprospiraceae bacterium]HRO07423.1 hypothetical protein [Saprospiraceae bacterium]HRO73810.1 hypothetical protein [Saprospiraceae bacterium]HRP40706.1 hypothetical protein [Saprospiraceae bacterium]
MRWVYILHALLLVTVVQGQYRYDAQMVMGYWGNDPVLQFDEDSAHINFQPLAFDLFKYS